MKRPIALHLKAALVCALLAITVALPLLWAPLLPAWQGWRPPVVDPRAEAVVAFIIAFWVAWCVVDIPRRGLKVLVWIATLWLLGSGVWIAGLYGHVTSSLVPVTAALLAGACGLFFSFTPHGSRRARWQSLVGPRVAPQFLRARIDESGLHGAPVTAVLAVAEILWPGVEGDEHVSWSGLAERAGKAARHFQQAGGYLERCDAEGARFVFGMWGQESEPAALVDALYQWVKQAGGCAALTRGECVCGVGDLPIETRWTVGGAPLRRAARMAAAARGYAAGLLVEDSISAEIVDGWHFRRIAWWDFEGNRFLLHEVTGPGQDAPAGAADDLRRWEFAWEAFWNGDWLTAENAFAALARERDDAAARVFALRSQSARRAHAET
ncbi:MAG: hypothetical protein JHD33_02070 [Chthoniobacterales bacterium]|jgi:hypothetical protein|nr:hypothetical protein [Chthoniobacterales bacterium]